MKIAFRHVPFTPAQRAELDEMARAGGYETLWYADGATPQAEELKDCEVLMGYFPPALLPELPALTETQIRSVTIGGAGENPISVVLTLSRPTIR